MSVAIHPSETRPNPGPPRAGRTRPKLRLAAGIVLGGTALAGFTLGAFSFFSGLADPRVRPVSVAPVASQWPDLKDGVPALAEGPAAQPTRLSLPPALAPAEPPTRRAEAAPAPVQQAARPEPVPPAEAEPARPRIVKAEVAKAEIAKLDTGTAEASKPEPTAEPVRRAASGRPNLPIEPAATLAPARTAASVVPAKVAAPLAPARAETVRAKAEQPARFVSLPAKAETPKAAPPKAEASKTETKATPRPEKAEAARRTAARTHVTTAEATPAAPAPAPAAAADDEPELLGMKIPGGRQLRDGWNAAVGGLIGKKDGE